MGTRSKQLRLIAASLTALTVTACGQSTAEPSKAPIPQALLTVNELAENPLAHLDRVTLVGVVGIVNQEKGFILIDSSEYQECGLAALTEAGTKKIPVNWSATAPTVKETVRVQGELVKDENGFTLTAEKVEKL